MGECHILGVTTRICSIQLHLQKRIKMPHNTLPLNGSLMAAAISPLVNCLFKHIRQRIDRIY